MITLKVLLVLKNEPCYALQLATMEESTGKARELAPDSESVVIDASTISTGETSETNKPQTNNVGDDDDVITDTSDLSNTARRVWIVTTAGLPWMTGTAVNPLLRSLSLAEKRPKDFVTLMIPWLPSAEARTTLYGAKNQFDSPADQEKWIRNYCIERCNCTVETASKLRIQFWRGVYQESFGSIFPLDDICSKIPRAEADICILEEPEHLNWFRVPARPKEASQQAQSEQGTALQDAVRDGEHSLEASEDSRINSFDNDFVDSDIEILGWSHKFRHVVGILHTNYADYVRQYGMASLVTAPALNALSSLVVKAFCHKVIRLSATLPHLDATKEVTCNVHGVRHEFLERRTSELEVEDLHPTKSDAEEKTSSPTENVIAYAPVYFIGKLIWAKGFEYVLELEEKFKEATGQYFSIDVYGGGKDEKEIKVAFYGRHNVSRAQSSASDADPACTGVDPEADKKAAAVFGSNNSLRDQLISCDGALVDDDYVLLINTTDTDGCEGASSAPSPVTTSEESITVPTTTSAEPDSEGLAALELSVDIPNGAPPLDVLGDLSGKTLSTTVDTADATMKLIESVMKAGLNALAGGKDGAKPKESSETSVSPKMSLPFHLAPAKTRFKVCMKSCVVRTRFHLRNQRS
jgi:hypothetical protein